MTRPFACVHVLVGKKKSKRGFVENRYAAACVVT